MEQAGRHLDGRGDQELLRAAAAGDVDAFGVVYERHKGFVFRVARRWCGGDDAALEVVQEVFLKLLEKVASGRGGGRGGGGVQLTGKLTTLLYPMAKHAAIGRRRQEGRRGEILREGVGPEAARREVGASADVVVEREDALRRALEGLSEEHREVVLMRVVDGMSVAEVSLALGIAEGTVKSRLFVGLGRLKEGWGG